VRTHLLDAVTTGNILWESWVLSLERVDDLGLETLLVRHDLVGGCSTARVSEGEGGTVCALRSAAVAVVQWRA
jgi:hypothetical protein